LEKESSSVIGARSEKNHKKSFLGTRHELLVRQNADFLPPQENQEDRRKLKTVHFQTDLPFVQSCENNDQLRLDFETGGAGRVRAGPQPVQPTVQVKCRQYIAVVAVEPG